MSVVAVLRLPLSVDLSGFVALLRRMQVQPEEVQQACFMPVAEALRLSTQLDYCPDSLDALKRYMTQG